MIRASLVHRKFLAMVGMIIIIINIVINIIIVIVIKVHLADRVSLRELPLLILRGAWVMPEVHVVGISLSNVLPLDISYFQSHKILEVGYVQRKGESRFPKYVLHIATWALKSRAYAQSPPSCRKAADPQVFTHEIQTQANRPGE